MTARALRLADSDDVAVLIDDVRPGEEVMGVPAKQAVMGGHKVALRAIPAGGIVRKYGQPIGIATCDIAAGEHVHTHNLTVGPLLRPQMTGATGDFPRPGATGSTFKGYRREDGRVGTRNFVGVLSSVNCSATVTRRIAAKFEEGAGRGIDGVAAFVHSGGCGTARPGEGIEVLERTLSGYAAHPNFGGVLLVGLGCEVAQVQGMLERHGLRERPRLRTLTIQDAGGTTAAIARGQEIVRDLIEEASGDRRAEVSAAHLVLGLQCGASDGWSGVTANPALGVAADCLVAEGGRVLLSETPEIYGAQHLLLRRAVSEEVAEALMRRIRWWEDYAARNGASLDNNPSPGNKAGGLTTIFEKSLGAVAKGGSSPLAEVVLYGERPHARGLVFMDSPGYDPCSATGQIASGANLLAFTTGRGSTFGSKPTPCLKIASNAPLAAHMSEDIDFDCSPILEGMPMEESGRRIFEALLEVASGSPTKSEALGLGDHEFVPWQLGAWL